MDITAGLTTADVIAEDAARLRIAQAALPSQAEIVNALAALADRWRDPNYPLRQEAEALHDPFPFAMVWVSLEAILDSLRPAELWALIDVEGCRGTQGFPIVGHVIAANTPLLAWVSVVRALLVRSASLVKLPSGPAAEWGRLFLRSLQDVSPALAECAALHQWPGGTADLDAALCQNADIVMAHGGDETMHALRGLCPPGTPFIGYGHRVSLAVLPTGTATPEALIGLARDVLLYDQGGCLSPQTVFVEGDWAETQKIAEQFAAALRQTANHYPLPVRSPRAAPAVREARALVQMEPDCQLWAGEELRWTVIARPESAFTPSPTFGVVSVQPLASLPDLPEAVVAVAPVLQGCAAAGEGTADYLPGVSRLCPPGKLQAPPLGWRQDGRDVLRVLLPPARCL